MTNKNSIFIFIAQRAKQLYFQYVKGNMMVGRFARVFSVDVVVRGGNYILIPVFLHLMTPQEIGIYDYLFQFAYLIAPILGLGVYLSMIKMYHDYQDKQERGKLLFTSHATIFIFLIASVGLIYSMKWDYVFVRFLIAEEIAYDRYRLFILIAIVWWIYNVFLTQFFVISENIPKIQRYNLGRFLMVNVVVFAALFFFKGDKIELRLACTYVTEMLVLLYFFRYFAREMVFKFDKTMFFKILKIALPTMLSFVAFLMLDFSDKFFVQKYVGMNTFAVYNKAVQFSLIITVIFASVWQIYQPFLFKERDIRTLQRKNNRLAKVSSVIFLGLAACLWGGVWLALRLKIIPTDYYDMIYVLPIILLTKIVIVSLLIYQACMIYFEKAHVILVSSVFFGIITIITNYFAVKMFSYYGSAVVLLIVHFLWTAFYYWRFSGYVRNRLKTDMPT